MRLPAKSLVVAIVGAATAMTFSADAGPTPRTSYRVAEVLKVGGEGRWDYITLDPKAGLLYVPRQTHTLVLKADSGQVVADLKETLGAHGVALVPERHRGFVSNGQKNTVTVFDLDTNKELGAVATGDKPDAIIYDPGSKKVLTFCGESNEATVIDPAADPATAKPAHIPLNGAPEFGVSDGSGRVYVNLEDKSAIDVIDTKAMKVIASWKIEGGEAPTGLAIDVAHHRLFSGCHNSVMAVLDTETGKTLATLPIGKGVDACAFDPGTGEAFASCGDGTLAVVTETSAGKFEVKTAQTRVGARTMALDPATHTIYLPTAEFEKSSDGGRPAAKPDSFMIVVVKPLEK